MSFKAGEAVLPHLGAAYNLARWLTRDDMDAEDVVQEGYLRALRHFGSFHGGDGRPWLLTIVRNTCYTYKQIGDVAEIPLGTVMSRLARARKRLEQSLASRGNKETSGRLAVGVL